MAERRTSLGVIFLTLFIDLVGFSILFPLIAGIMHYFDAQNSGVVHSVGQWIADIYPAADAEQRAALMGGILMGLYAVLQFICAPLWGALSDRIGRRPVLMITILGNTLGYGLWIVADSFVLVLVTRAVCGLMAGNISVATAAVADVTDAKSRAKGMGFIGMAFGLGFILGPAIGGLTYTYLPGWSGGTEPGLGLNPFSWPAIVACALSLINLVWVARRFTETRPPTAAPKPGHRVINPLAIFSSQRSPIVRKVIMANLLFGILFAGLEATLVFLAWDALDYGPGAMAAVFVVLGFTSAMVQGGLVRRMAPKYGAQKLAAMGLIIMIPAFATLGVVAWVPSAALLYTGIVLLALGVGLVMPTFATLVSLGTSDDQQGAALGAFRSAGALARAVGPFIGAGTYFAWGPATPFMTGAALMIAPLFLILGGGKQEVTDGAG